jgi:hypothetical protein
MTRAHARRQASAPLGSPTRDASRLRPAAWIIVGVLAVAALAPTIGLPLGPDSAMFFVSAQKILHQGAAPYRDIVDVKPPLLYYVYAAIMGVFGETAVALRIVDVLVQSLTCAAIAALVRRSNGGDVWAALAAFSYALLYGSLGYAYTMQAESYVGLVVAIAGWLVVHRRSAASLIAAGALAGIACLLKFPLGVIVVALLAYEMIVSEETARRTFGNCALIVAGFVAIASLLGLYLIVFDAADGFAGVSAFIAGYARTRANGAGALIGDLLKLMPRQLVAVLSLTLVAAALASIPALIARRNATADDDRGLRLLRYAWLVIAALLASVVVEGKYYPYQVARLDAAVAIAGAWGLARGAHAISRAWGAAYGKAIAVIVPALALAFGPVATWAWFTATPVALGAIEGHAAYDAWFDRMRIYYPRTELEEVGRYVVSARGASGRVLALSSIGALVHYHSGSVPEYRIYHSAFLLAGFAPATWRGEIRAYAIGTRPAIIVVQRGDSLFELTGSHASSDALVETLGLRALLEHDYVVGMSTERFVVYRRR